MVCWIYNVTFGLLIHRVVTCQIVFTIVFVLGWCAKLVNFSLNSIIMQDQLGRVYLLSGLLFIMLGLGSDGVPSLVQSRTPPPAMMGLPELPASLRGYSYVIMKLGPLAFTRKGLSIASTAACLTFMVSGFLLLLLIHCFTFLVFNDSCILNFKRKRRFLKYNCCKTWKSLVLLFWTFFTEVLVTLVCSLIQKKLWLLRVWSSIIWKVFQSASLCLTTTTPEQLACGLRWFLLPLRHLGVSVSEIVLTLLLSLRFVSLVFDEVRIFIDTIWSHKIY